MIQSLLGALAAAPCGRTWLSCAYLEAAGLNAKRLWGRASAWAGVRVVVTAAVAAAVAVFLLLEVASGASSTALGRRVLVMMVSLAPGTTPGRSKKLHNS